MAITYVSSAAAAGNTVAMPTHQAGDLILVHAYRDGSIVGPTPASGYANFARSGGDLNSSAVGYKWAASGSESVGTWNNATGIVVHVYRGVSRLGAAEVATGSGNTIAYPPATLKRLGSTSWAARFAGHRTATNINSNTPAGYVHRSGVASECRGCDTNAALSANPGSATQSVNASSGWIARTVELRGDEGAPAASLSDAFDGTTSTPDPAKWVLSTGNGGVFQVDTGTQELSITGPPGFSPDHMASIQPIDLTDDSVTFGPVGAVVGSETFAAIRLGIALDPNSSADWGFTLSGPSGQVSAIGIGLSPVSEMHVAGDYYRIRHGAGSLWWERSSDGLAWSTMTSQAVGTAPTSAEVQISCWDSATCRLGGVNELPAAGLPVKQYTSGNWEQIGVLKAHNGTDWVKPKYWNGAEWV